MDYEKAQANIDSLVVDVSNSNNNRNEATIRIQIIDRLLLDCLGWPIDQAELERIYKDDRVDYELGKPARSIVVEAKKEGAYFELPAGYNKETCKIQTLFKISDDIKSAIEQAIGYCLSRSIPVGVICNGHQLIAFLGSRQDGVPSVEGNALVFNSLEEISKRFRQFWDCLSPEGIRSRHIQHLLAEKDFVPPPDKLSKHLIDYPGYKNRNSSAVDLQILGGLFLEDIPNNPEYKQDFVKNTYCESGALSQYALISKEILSSRYNLYLDKNEGVSSVPVKTKKGLAPPLREDLLAASLSSRPILLVGDVGVGKSMFIQHLVLVDAKDLLKNAIVLRIDFGNKPTLATDLSEYVRAEIERQLIADFEIDIFENRFTRRVYRAELKRFEGGIHATLKGSDPQKFQEKEIEYLESLLMSPVHHLEKSLSYIVKENNKQIVLFLDNVDQRPVEFQDQVFLIGQSFAQTLPLTVFIALRPETFSFSRKAGTLSAYQPRVFTIDPPRVDKVICNRLKYALDTLRKSHRLPHFPASTYITSKKLEDYMHMLLNSISNSDSLIEFIDNMSNGNIRKALDFITAFVGSGHVDSEKIFRILDEDNKYRLPLHEFLRSVLYGNNIHFDPVSSPILNIFDIITNDDAEHFLVLALLSCVERSAIDLHTEGFVALDHVYRQLQGFGFSDVAVKATLEKCIEKQLISPPKIQSVSNYDRIRILSAGAYTAKRLGKLFAYVDAMIVDTPITRQEFRDKIYEVEQIEERLDRAVIFVDYLNACWNENLLGLVDWPRYRADLMSDINSIKQRVPRRF